MTSAVVETGFTNSAFESFLAERDEPAWLTECRRGAWEQFETLPMPSRSDEEWMRTDLRLFHLDKFGFPVPASEELPPEPLLAHGVDLAGQLTSLNSHEVDSFLDEKLSEQGVLFGSLDQMVAQHGDLLRPYLERNVVDPVYDRFAALHAAAWSGGTLLYVPRGVTIERPLLSLSALAEGGVDLGHVLVVLEDGANATLLAETASTLPEAAGLHCGAIGIIVGRGANLRYVNLQNWSQKVWHFAHHKAVVEQDANIQWTNGGLGSRLAKVNQHVALAGPGANAQVNGVIFTEGRQHLCYNTLQHHEAEGCTSDLLYKGALQDQSHIVWRGMIKVDPGAQKTDGYQRNDNLMLSPRSHADSIPGLEIEADDVRCTHGSTSGRVDDELIFYCRSRGMTNREAVRMIVSGFFQQISDRITIDSVRDALAEAISVRVREVE